MPRDGSEFSRRKMGFASEQSPRRRSAADRGVSTKRTGNGEKSQRLNAKVEGRKNRRRKMPSERGGEIPDRGGNGDGNDGGNEGNGMVYILPPESARERKNRKSASSGA